MGPKSTHHETGTFATHTDVHPPACRKQDTCRICVYEGHSGMKTWCPGESDAGASLRPGARLLSGLLSSSAAHVRNALLMGTLHAD